MLRVGSIILYGHTEILFHQHFGAFTLYVKRLQLGWLNSDDFVPCFKHHIANRMAISWLKTGIKLSAEFKSIFFEYGST